MSVAKITIAHLNCISFVTALSHFPLSFNLTNVGVFKIHTDMISRNKTVAFLFFFHTCLYTFPIIVLVNSHLQSPNSFASFQYTSMKFVWGFSIHILLTFAWNICCSSSLFFFKPWHEANCGFQQEQKASPSIVAIRLCLPTVLLRLLTFFGSSTTCLLQPPSWTPSMQNFKLSLPPS